MANEGIATFNLKFTKGGAQFNARPQSISPSFDVAGSYAIQQIFTIAAGTAVTALDLENVGTPGYVFFHNMGGAPIILGNNAVSFPNRIRPDGYALVEWNGANIYAQAAGTSACDLEALILPQ